jgi:diguanylate cyclase (GGDEF)-like protein
MRRRFCFSRNLKILLALTFLLMLGAIGFSVIITSQMNAALPEPWRQQSFVMSVVVPSIISPPIWAIISWILIRNDRLLRRVEDLANFDPLTGLLNRRAFFEIGCRKVASVQRSITSTMSIAMIDLDHFKTINDTYGHAAGDAALIGLARLICHEDLAKTVNARLGGDEFAILFTGAGASTAASHMRRIEDSLASSSLLEPIGVSVKITASIGLACVEINREADSRVELEKLLVRADEALYAAKSEGRNRVTMAA